MSPYGEPQKNGIGMKGFALGLASGTLGLLAIGGVFVLLSVFLLSHRGGPAKKDGNIGIVQLSGVIMDAGDVLDQLREYVDDDKIKAVVLRVDSPGGAVAPSQEIQREVLRTRETKKVVVSMGTLAASGGYYVASAADQIVASEGTITGSIGVIAQTPELTKLAEWMKVRQHVYKSGKLKDAGSPWREPSVEDTAMLQDMVENIYEQFLGDVAKNRKLPIEDLRKIADGRIFTGKQALELKLIDRIGNFYDAVKLAGDLAGVKDPQPAWPPEPRDAWLRELVLGSVSRVKDILLESGRSTIRIEAVGLTGKPH